MKWIAIAGPYSSGGAGAEERAARLAAMNEAAVAVLAKGWTPVIGVNMALPVIAAAGSERFDDIMQPLSNALASRCDAVLRIGGRSDGADQEVDLVRRKGGDIFRRLEDVPDLT